MQQVSNSFLTLPVRAKEDPQRSKSFKFLFLCFNTTLLSIDNRGKIVGTGQCRNGNMVEMIMRPCLVHS